MTTVYVVSDHDYDSTWIVAAYPTETMAEEHVAAMGGYVEACEVRDALHPDVTDPKKVRERENEAAAAEREWRARERRDAAAAKARAEMRPRPPHMNLCHCETFTNPRFRNAHGYCGYCGGFAPAVFREHMGEAALQEHIDRLELWKREKMRALCALR